MELSLPKKLIKHAVEGFFVFSFSLKHFKYVLRLFIFFETFQIRAEAVGTV